MTEEYEDNEEEVKPRKPAEKLEKIPMDKLRGRVIILNPEESEFSKRLSLTKKGDFFKKKV